MVMVALQAAVALQVAAVLQAVLFQVVLLQAVLLQAVLLQAVLLQVVDSHRYVSAIIFVPIRSKSVAPWRVGPVKDVVGQRVPANPKIRLVLVVMAIDRDSKHATMAMLTAIRCPMRVEPIASHLFAATEFSIMVRSVMGMRGF